MQKIISLFLLSALVSTGCKPQKNEVEEANPESLRKQIKPTEVTAAIAEYRPFEFRMNASGIIESENELKVTFQTSGFLEKLLATNGQRVKKGQLLAALENNREELALEKAQLAVEKAQIQMESDSMSRVSNWTPQVRHNLQLNSGLRSARVSLKEATFNLSNTLIYAPITGMMSEVKEKQGNIVSSGKELGLIYDPENLMLKGKVLETDFKYLRKGLKANIYPLSLPGQPFQATLTEINPRVDENGMITIKLKLNETKGLLPGMNANAVIRVPQSKNVIVPREALVMKSGKPVVFTIADGLAKWNYVETGLDNGVDLEITKGIEAGSRVITSNNLQLAHEARVSVTETNLREAQ